MGYLIAAKAVERVKHILDEMVATQEDLEFKSELSSKLAYNIREGIGASKLLPQYIQYATLDSKFVIKALPGRVVCELRIRPTLLIQKQLAVLTLAEIVTIEQCVGACIEHNFETILFPSLVLDVDDLTKLHKWTSLNGYFIINHEENGITLTKKETDLAWEPVQK